MTKICKTCREEKPLTEFYRHCGFKDGYRASCKACANVAIYRWNSEQRVKKLAINNAWRNKNKEHVRAQRRARDAANSEAVKAKRRKWYAENIEKGRAYARKWTAENREKANTGAQIRRARVAGAIGSHTAEEVKALFLRQRGLCAVCRCDITDKYDRDHIVPLARGGDNTILNIQLLCPSCNGQKGSLHPVEFMQRKGFLL